MRHALFGVLLSALTLSACGGEPQTATSTGASAGAAGSGGTTGGTAGQGGTGATGGTSSTGGTTTSSAGGTSAGASGAGGTGAMTGSGGSGAMTGSGGSGAMTGSGGSGGMTGSGGSGPVTAASCFADDYVNMPMNGPNYDQYNPVIGSHCMGTNHQDITGVQRVVFLGDSITVGTPPTLANDFYRTELADAIADKFSLAKPNFLWQNVDVFNGVTIVKESGDFASCSKWGARTDDLLVDNTQITDCFPAGSYDKRTLVVMTMGGNDIASLTKDATNGVPMDQLWIKTQDFVQKLRDAVEWFRVPGRFPNGVFVVFANNYEFTDGTGNVQACDVSGLAGFDKPVPAPQELAAMVVWANEQYLKVAVDTQSDMIFLLEDFCGHGFEHDNPAAPCYRGPGTDVWFDLTCIHPNPTGHDHIRDMFMAVVNE